MLTWSYVCLSVHLSVHGSSLHCVPCVYAVVGARPQDAAFFDHNNPVGLAERERAFQLALADMLGYLRSDAGQVAIFDATNSTQDRREKLVRGSFIGGGVRVG